MPAPISLLALILIALSAAGCGGSGGGGSTDGGTPTTPPPPVPSVTFALYSLVPVTAGRMPGNASTYVVDADNVFATMDTTITMNCEVKATATDLVMPASMNVTVSVYLDPIGGPAATTPTYTSDSSLYLAGPRRRPFYGSLGALPAGDYHVRLVATGASGVPAGYDAPAQTLATGLTISVSPPAPAGAG